MGLFDNLFLDQNTPVTINDGNDHSHDATTVIVDKIPTPPVSAKEDVVKSPPPEEMKDATLVDLFDTDKKEENEAKAIMTPEPEKDIALEIGQGPAGGLPKMDESVSFDIGGDISFDIGGDMGGISFGGGDPVTTSTPVIQELTQSPPPSVQVTGSTDVIPNTPAVSDNPAIEMGDMSNMPVIFDVGTSPDSSSASQNNPLFSLLNNSISSTNAPIDPIPTNNSQNTPNIPQENSIGATSNSVQMNGIFGLVEQSGVPDSPSSPGGTVGEIQPQGRDTVQNSSLFDTTISSGGISSNAGDTSSREKGEMTPPEYSSRNVSGDTSILHSAPTSLGTINPPKLRAKISQFLSELDSLEIGDQNDREHKLEQIEMCKMRIREIQAESERRIDALRHEIQELEHEIESMDQEKNRIKNVIQSFQKELDAV